MKRASFVLVVAAACSGGGKKDPIMLTDAPKAPDAAPVPCLIEPSMATVTPSQQEAHAWMGMDETAPSNYYLYADLNQDPTPDVMLVDLYKGYGALAAGWPTAPMTIPLMGDEINYATCGACVLVYTDYTADGPTGEPYMATSGVLQLMTAGPTMLEGKLTNVALSMVTIDEETAETTAHPSGCTSMIGSVDFAATIEPQMAKVSGETRLRLHLKPSRISGASASR